MSSRETSASNSSNNAWLDEIKPYLQIMISDLYDSTLPKVEIIISNLICNVDLSTNPEAEEHFKNLVCINTKQIVGIKMRKMVNDFLNDIIQSRIQEMPEIPEMPEISEIPEMPEMPEISEISEMSEQRETSLHHIRFGGDSDIEGQRMSEESPASQAVSPAQIIFNSAQTPQTPQTPPPAPRRYIRRRERNINRTKNFLNLSGNGVCRKK